MLAEKREASIPYHEDRGRRRVHRPGACLQPPLPADVLASSGRADRLYAGVWLEKGQVENQVGTIRDVLFRPRPKVKTLEELNAPSVT